MMKKLAALLLVLSMIFSVSAWAEENGISGGETEAVPEWDMPTEGETTADVAQTDPGQTEATAQPETVEAFGVTNETKTDETAGDTETAGTPEEAGSPEETEETKLTEIPEEAEAPAAETLEVPAAQETAEAVIAPEPQKEPAAQEIAEEVPAPEPQEAPATQETTEKASVPEPQEAPATQETTEKAPVPEPQEEPADAVATKSAETAVDGQETPAETADVLSATAVEETEAAAPENATPQTDVLNAATEKADVLSMSDYANENSVRGFVYRLYRTVFQREPDAAGMNHWVNKLETGNDTAAGVVSFFFNSDEYKNSKKSNGEIVSDCYNTMLNRNPEAAGYEYWKQRLDIGMTPQSVLAGFVYSPEFTAIVSKYGVVRGDMKVTNPRDKNYERTYFVYRLYNNCLGRGADLAGEEYWCEQLEKGTTGAEIASGFFFSDEFNKNRYNNSAFVQLLYRAIQGREYDVNGLIHWTNRLNLADTREKVLNGFILSPEFNAQCVTAEIKAGDPLPTPDDSIEWQYNIQVLRLCNQERRKAGLGDLYTREDLLWDLAMARAKETTEQFSHTRPNGTSCFTLFKEQGFYGYLGENLAAGTPYQNPATVVEAWMNSQGHRENIMNPNYTYLATGYLYDPDAKSYCADGKYTGQYVNFGAYAAQSFCNYGVKID